MRVLSLVNHARALHRLGLLCAALWSLTLLQPQQAAADSRDDQARVLFEKGIEASDAEHWAEAIDAFRRSLALVERPSTRFNLITALYRHGQYQEATEVARQYLSLTDPEKDKAKRAEVEKLLADMRDDLGTLALDVSPSHAQVRVDGTLLPSGKTRHDVPLAPGKHEVVLSAEGYSPRIESVAVERGVRTLVSLRLSPLAEVKVTPAAPVIVATPRPEADPAFLEARRRNDLQIRITELNRDMARLEEAIAAANNKKPLIYLGLGTAFLISGIVMASVSEDSGPAVAGVLLSITGGGFVLASFISGLVRRSKRGYYQRRLDRAKADKEGLELELNALVSPEQQGAGLTLRF